MYESSSASLLLFWCEGEPVWFFTLGGLDAGCNAARRRSACASSSSLLPPRAVGLDVLRLWSTFGHPFGVLFLGRGVVDLLAQCGCSIP